MRFAKLALCEWPSLYNVNDLTIKGLPNHITPSLIYVWTSCLLWRIRTCKYLQRTCHVTRACRWIRNVILGDHDRGVQGLFASLDLSLLSFKPLHRRRASTLGVARLARLLSEWRDMMMTYCTFTIIWMISWMMDKGQLHGLSSLLCHDRAWAWHIIWVTHSSTSAHDWYPKTCFVTTQKFKGMSTVS